MKKDNKIVAIQGDPISTINQKTDTTLLLALEAQLRGYKIYYYETKNLNYINGKVQAHIKELKLFENNKKFYKIVNQKLFDLSKANYVLIRQNPPFNMDYITATFFLEHLPRNVKVVNNPVSVRNVSEKFYSVNFLKYMPPTIFTKNIEEIKKFVKKYKKIVIKPIHGYGGKNILFVNKSINQIKVLSYIKKFGKPAFIEFKTYRWLEHVGPNSDINLGYRSKKEVMSWIPMQRFGEPDEVAPIAAFLSREEARYITGDIIRVDGGMASRGCSR